MPSKKENKKVEKVETSITLDNIINPIETDIAENTKSNKKITIKKKAKSKIE